jgi:thioredoxin-like negative regulator of GroEL
MRSYKAQTSLLAMVLLVAAMPAMGQEDKYNAGMAAMSKGDVIGAEAGFCAAGDFKDAKAQCEQMKKDANALRVVHNKRYTDGIDEMQKGNYEKAESLFRSVKYGTFVEQAKGQLAEATKMKLQKQQQDAAAQQNAQAAQNAEAKFNEGVTKFSNGDLAGAKAAFDAVTGNRQAEAGNYLARINNYNAKMSEGKSFENQGKFREAQGAYTAASLQIPTSDAANAVQRAMTALNSGSSPTPNTQQAAPEIKAASKDVVKQIDIASYLSQGKKLLAKNDFARARRFFGDVLAQDPRNAEAQAGLAEAVSKDTSKPEATAEDKILSAAVRTFYEGDFKAAEFRLDDYIYNNRGKKMGLANFYRGVVYLQQYYLGGEKDAQAYQQAVKRFQTAKTQEGFVPPEKYVSPRIIKVYKEAAGS